MARKEILLTMLETDPDDPFLHYALGKEYLSCGERTAAIEKLRHVLERFPNYHAAHFQLGQVLAEDGESSQAIEIVKAGIIAAQQDGDQHAVSEMTGFLDTLGQ
ncbi:MAG: tetratricopeptide repeat protein [Planctomycetaceae bacterium]|jgi:predicted Zn-dependent protease|nr:tetratricopeptide repeat protein [bacterium]MDC0273256.1 tetratricopeptide repeat protein [Planctomycetaceae bacterium]MDG2387951.1 tetratricopeptide repeat protein [Planctomycetaceae bacterium]